MVFQITELVRYKSRIIIPHLLLVLGISLAGTEKQAQNR